MTNIPHARASENGQSAFAVDLKMGDYQLLGDEPRAAGGANLGPQPFELLAAALAECTAMTVRWYARQHALPLQHVAVDVDYVAERDADANKKEYIFTKTVALTGPDLSSAQRQKLLEVAAICPVHKVLAQGATLHTSEVPPIS